MSYLPWMSKWVIEEERKMINLSSISWWEQASCDEIIMIFTLYWLVGCMVFSATFNNISDISWRSVLLVEETGGPGENPAPIRSRSRRPQAVYWTNTISWMDIMLDYWNNSVGRHVSSIGHIIVIPCHVVFSLTP